MSGVKFIRVKGRIIPIKEKNYTGQKTVDRGIVDRVKSGAKTGGKIGLGIGAFAGVISGLDSATSTLGMVGRIGTGALRAGASLGVIGGVAGGIFGSRRGAKKIRKKKYTSI